MPGMRGGIMACAVLLATVASASEGEAPAEAEERRMFVGLVPVPLDRGLIAVDGEWRVGPKLSVRIGGRFGARLSQNESVRGAGEVHSDVNVGLEPGVRYYLTGTTLDGLWIGPHLELSRGWFTHELLSTTLGVNASLLSVKGHGRSWSAGAGVLIGYSVVLPRGLTVQAGVGFGASYSSIRTTTPGVSPGLNQLLQSHSRSWGAAERATLAVGWAF